MSHYVRWSGSSPCSSAEGAYDGAGTMRLFCLQMKINNTSEEIVWSLLLSIVTINSEFSETFHLNGQMNMKLCSNGGLAFTTVSPTESTKVKLNVTWKQLLNLYLHENSVCLFYFIDSTLLPRFIENKEILVDFREGYLPVLHTRRGCFFIHSIHSGGKAHCITTSSTNWKKLDSQLIHRHPSQRHESILLTSLYSGTWFCSPYRGTWSWPAACIRIV